MKVYRYKRGTTFSCLVNVTNNDTFSFSNIQYPEDATSEVIELFLNEAETAVIKAICEIEEAV